MSASDALDRLFEEDEGPARFMFDPVAERVVAANARALTFFGEASRFALAERSFAQDDAFLALARATHGVGQPRKGEVPFTSNAEPGVHTVELVPRALADGRPGLRVTILSPRTPTAPPEVLRFADALRALPAALVLARAGGEILFVNAAAHALAGAAGPTLADVLGADAARLVQDALAGPGHFSRALAIGRSGPRRSHIEARRTGSAQHGGPLDILLLRDLTGLMAVEAGFALERETLTELLDLSADFVWACDPAGRLTYVTAGFTTATGLKPSAVLGRRWFDPSEDLDAEEGAEALFAAAPQSFQDLGVRLSSPEKGRLSLRLSARSVLDAQGAFQGYRGVARVLRPGESYDAAGTARLAQLVDATADGLLITDPDGRVLYSNAAAARLLGRERAGLAGRRLASLLAPESRVQLLALLSPRPAGPPTDLLAEGCEVEFLAERGERVPVLLLVRPFKAGGPLQLCFVLRDLAYFKRVEGELMRAKESAESANRQKTEFLAKVSHEIRTPLNAIIGFTEIMRSEQLGPIGNSRYRGYIEDIHHSGQLLLALINDLLDLSKVELGRETFRFEPVDVAAVLEQCLSLMEPAAHAAGVALEARIAPHLAAVLADERSLEQIVLNLLSNAVKFTKPGGRVVLAASSKGEAGVTISVRDTGIGMSDAEIETALKPFTRVERPEVLSKPGTGLGLPLAKALTEANQASFHIASAPKSGTAVEITFPRSAIVTTAT